MEVDIGWMAIQVWMVREFQQDQLLREHLDLL